MIDLGNFKIFLSSLAPVTQVHYQIWGNNGEFLFSTGKVIPPEFPVTESQNIYRHIIDQKTFQYRRYDTRNFLCGIPLKNNQDVWGALIAFGKKPSGQNQNGAADMENFLSTLSAFVQEKQRETREIEELTYELEKSFEDLYLYSKITSQIKTLRMSEQTLESLLEELLENMRVEAAFAILSNGREYNLQLVKPQVSEKFSQPKDIFEKLFSKKSI